ncbi:hypothetical protein HPP92_017889 [Vanilla planifolia]|uniref:WRKY domain-containing protein n=1 Tax=Vanilla planifolia TaxID=51239 RepID=A0A835Q8S9_VANPL|nr:hypothetical protein HPP92_017889 [Vanilla planifolia]
MAEGRGRGGGSAENSKRPSISLPPQSAVESLFRGGQVEASPGPMTLVSSFFAEDSDSECRSFSQLLAGAMASPPAAAAAVLQKFPAEDGGTTTSIRSKEEATANGRGGGGSLNLGHSRPMNLLMAQLPFFTVPPGFSPGGLLESPAMFSSNLGNFALSHQAQSAQATHSHVQMNNQEEKASSLSLASMVQTSGAMMEKPLRIQNLNQVTNGHDSNSFVASDVRSQLASITVDKPADDGYNWRKYGQKQVKGSEFQGAITSAPTQTVQLRKRLNVLLTDK